ncbi:MAG: bifunctional hydroxymethylpyrimidine kinase/phosphomethylpyrimidine kinase [Oscillospiraceae bacterium]|nr:bifunctional hydroxymethylpyrimidine kinase/phosphomethylpyrimidine kinase [Oscillospiraceae bacterium]
MPDVVVIGAANVDVGAVSGSPLVKGDSNPGRVGISLGGVGRNIAHNLCLLGVDTAMITVLGEDPFANVIRTSAGEIGLDLSRSAVIPGARSSTYVFVADSTGDMALAVSDMDICRQITPAFLEERLDFINSAKAVVIDANLPEESISWLCGRCTAPVIADPVSTVKAERLRGVLGKLYAFKPNRLEAERLSGISIVSEEDAFAAAEKLLETGLKQVYISLSSAGICAASGTGERARFGCPKVGIVNATGGGDAMVAALTASLLQGDSLTEAARNAICAGAFASTAETTIHPLMSWTELKKLRDSEVYLT